VPKRSRQYQNPILTGFHPDPSICRVGSDFYLVTSSFEYFPGIPIFHSRDLIHFRQIGFVLSRSSQLPLDNEKSSGGIYAPTIRYHRGRFFVVCTNVHVQRNFLVTARRPEGPWSEPLWIDREGFDPSLFFDGDDVHYTRDAKGPDVNHPLIVHARLDVETGKLRGRLKPIFAGTGGVWPEASHLYLRGDWYYLVIAEGGTSYEHSVVVARSRKPVGPFEPCPFNPVLTHVGRRRDAFQAIGHADLVDTPDGETFAVLLGIRPTHGRYHHLGRETFLVPVTWGDDGWPRFGSDGRVLPKHVAPRLKEHTFPTLKARDDFDTNQLRLEYLLLRNPPADAHSLTARPGYLRLNGLAGSSRDTAAQAFVGRRQTDFACRCRSKLEFAPLAMSDEAGLVVRNSERFHYRLVVRRSSLTDLDEREAQLWSVIAGKQRLVGRVALHRGPVVLEIAANEAHYVFRAGTAKLRHTLGELPTRKLSTEYSTRRSPSMCFTGVVFGMYASGQGEPASAPADFDWFEYQPQ
jgi:alpha-N-arabinofuranosidase